MATGRAPSVKRCQPIAGYHGVARHRRHGNSPFPIATTPCSVWLGHHNVLPNGTWKTCSRTGRARGTSRRSISSRVDRRLGRPFSGSIGRETRFSLQLSKTLASYDCPLLSTGSLLAWGAGYHSRRCSDKDHESAEQFEVPGSTPNSRAG